MGIYTRVALQTTVIGWAATCDEQTDGHSTVLIRGPRNK